MDPMLVVGLVAVLFCALFAGGTTVAAALAGLRLWRARQLESEPAPQINTSLPLSTALPPPGPDPAHAQVLRRSELFPAKPPTGLRPSEVATPKQSDEREEDNDIKSEEDDSDAATVTYRLQDQPNDDEQAEFMPLQPDDSRQRRR